MGRTYGLNAVDWEQRANFDRLRTERLDARESNARAVGARLACSAST